MKYATLTRRSVMLVIGSALLMSMLLAGCGGDDEQISVPTGAQAGDLLGLETCAYEVDGEEYPADCGTLIVPENRNDPTSRLIALPVVRVRAAGENPDEPIFRFAGGAGLSNMTFKLTPWFLEDHDVVLVGYRGVDGSVRLDCPEVAAEFRRAGGEDMLNQAALEALAASFANCANRLEGEGVDLAGYTVTELIDDMEAARLALGYDRINLFSWSWGTDVARIYSYMYPEHIHRSVMIGVDVPGGVIHEAETVDTLLGYYAELCAQDAVCSTRTNDLAETMRTVSHDMPELWLLLPINPGLMKAVTSNFLELTSEAPSIIDVWLSAAEGDASGMAALSIIGRYVYAGASVWGHNAALRSSMGEFDATRDYLAELNPPDSIIGSPATTVAYAEYTAWPAHLIPEEYRMIQASDVETLLISGSIDFDTPAELARDVLLPSLSNGQQVILSEFGHVSDIASRQPEALRHLLINYYATGVSDDSLYVYQEVDFEVGFGFPEQAKLAVAVMVLLPIGLVALVWFVVRKRRRRSQL
ncbi:MAG: alpha/beta fold hydrolase [Anaerolineales bacterium]